MASLCSICSRNDSYMHRKTDMILGWYIFAFFSYIQGCSRAQHAGCLQDIVYTGLRFGQFVTSPFQPNRVTQIARENKSIRPSICSSLTLLSSIHRGLASQNGYTSATPHSRSKSPCRVCIKGDVGGFCKRRFEPGSRPYNGRRTQSLSCHSELVQRRGSMGIAYVGCDIEKEHIRASHLALFVPIAGCEIVLWDVGCKVFRGVRGSSG